MKVLVFTTTFPNPVQPTHGVFVQERIRRLADRCDLRVVAPSPWHRRGVPHHEHRAGLDVWHPTFWYVPRFLKFLDGFFLFLSSLATVTRLRRAFDFDLIDAHFTYPDGVAASWLAWWFDKPYTITERGTLFYHARRSVLRHAIRRALSGAARVFAVSHELGEVVRRLGVAEERLEVIPNGVDTIRFRPGDRAAARRRLGLPEAGRLLVSVGQFAPRKGFQRVLAVLPALVHDHPDLTFAIIGGPGGEGDNGPALRRQIAELGLDRHALLVGPKPPDDVATWLNAADLFVLATDFEGCPNVVNEALACGVPVVVSRVGEADRMIPSGAGLLVDNPEDAGELEGCLREALDRTWDRAAIRTAVEGRTWEAVADRVLEQWRLAADRSVLAAPELVGR